MIIQEPKYNKLIEYIRNGLVQREHCGIIIHINKNGIINKIGEDNNYKFYHRSCMKPMQVSPLIDLGLDIKLKLTLEEIALCCASHTGELIHQEKIISVLNKIGLSEKDLLCHAEEPLSKNEQKRLIKENINPDRIHNNCSGKHSAMLAICKELNFNTANYKDLSHPLSDYIIKKVCELCEIKKDDIIISKDGCGLPVIATPLFNLGLGFLNLFLNKKYEKIKDAFLNYPYLIGGKDRLDSDIIANSENLIAKVGAEGLCVVVNIIKEEVIIVKIADSSMEARAHTVINALEQMNWVTKENIKKLKQIYPAEIKSQDGETLGRIKPCFNLSKCLK